MFKIFSKLQLFIVLLVSGSILSADPYSLANVSQYLTNLKLLKANFLQFNADGTLSSGVILIKRPGRMRFEYYKPDKTLVLVSAGALAIFDPKGDEAPITYPIKNNPISLILKSEVNLLNSGIVENYKVINEEATLTIRDPKKPERGSVELVFAGVKPELAKFTVKNENGSSTSLFLEDIEYPKKINETLFSIPLETNKRLKEK
ncbi:MAG: outer membrane lipoprotein carrier protein LolA [Rhodobacteraceae bacterium]|nr:outer membrane lipoprotein carrier protein LolA [Paracoccaceae bacterium]